VVVADIPTHKYGSTIMDDQQESAMRKSFSLSLSFIEPLDREAIMEFHRRFLELQYSEEQGLGFRKVSLSSDYISATLLKRTPTFISQYDAQTGQMIEREVFLYSEVGFGLDGEFQLLEVYGTAKDASKVRAALRLVLQPRSRLVPVNLAPADVILSLSQSSVRISVDRLTVANFQHSDGIIGRYDMRLTLPDLVTDIIEKYSHDVTKATISVVSSDFGDFDIDVSSSSRLTIKCEEQQFDEVFAYLKSFLFRTKE
jgi:hypothetical protein